MLLNPCNVLLPGDVRLFILGVCVILCNHASIPSIHLLCLFHCLLLCDRLDRPLRPLAMLHPYSFLPDTGHQRKTAVQLADTQNRTTSMGGSQLAYVQLTKIVDPDEWRARCRDYLEAPPSHERENDRLSYTDDVSSIIRGPVHCTFWASSPRPDLTAFDFAVATNLGTAMVSGCHRSSWSFNPFQLFGSERFHAGGGGGVLAVDWLDRNVTLNGCRDGIVRLWDTRARGVEATSARVRHGSCVNHVRRLDEGGNRVVVAGLERRMAVYDLRFLGAKEGDFSCSFSSSSSSSSKRVTTRPYVEFPGYGNKEMNGVAVGFDVCGDLIAAGTDEKGLQVFDGTSGREVVVGGGGMRKKLGGPARCLQFVEMEEAREGRKLFVADGTGIQQWAW